MKSIDRPVFIVGSGRSGTTILYQIMASHRDLCWFSNISDRFPHTPVIPITNRVVELPWIGDKTRHRIFNGINPTLRPAEGPRTYHKFCGFDHRRRMTEEDWTPELDECLKSAIRNHLRWTGKPRFLGKQTANNQRIRLIDKMFPDAYYIHIIRDGRAVASSLLKVPWHDRIYFWWLEGTVEKWVALGRDPIELCAIHWEKDEREILNNKHLFGDRYLEIRYEDLVTDSENVISRILQFCQLSDYPAFYETIPPLKNMNYKWSTGLTDEQKRLMEQSIGRFLLEQGYELEVVDPASLMEG